MEGAFPPWDAVGQAVLCPRLVPERGQSHQSGQGSSGQLFFPLSCLSCVPACPHSALPGSHRGIPAPQCPPDVIWDRGGLWRSWWSSWVVTQDGGRALLVMLDAPEFTPGSAAWAWGPSWGSANPGSHTQSCPPSAFVHVFFFMVLNYPRRKLDHLAVFKCTAQGH